MCPHGQRKHLLFFLQVSPDVRIMTYIGDGWVKICGPGQGAKAFFKGGLEFFFKKLGAKSFYREKGGRTRIYDGVLVREYN